MTAEDVSRHEAGHATACLLLKIPLVGFGRCSDGGYTRLVDFLPEEVNKDTVKDR